jgi:hypothetical protein
MNNCIYCGSPTQRKVCMAKACQNKRKNQYRLDHLDRFHKLEKDERDRNYAGRKNRAAARTVKRYYSSNLVDVVAVMHRHAKSRAKTYGMEFDLDKEFLSNLFDSQKNKCALTGIEFRYDKEKDDLRHKRPFAPSLDRIDCKVGYIKGNVRLVCVIVNFALSEFGDEAFDEMCQAYIRSRHVK